jgi:DNA-binding NtrC family response regulator
VASADSSISVRIPLGSMAGTAHHADVIPASSFEAQWNTSLVRRLVQMARELADARERERDQSIEWPQTTRLDSLGLIAASEKTTKLLDTTARVAQGNVTVLITGETGTGKELIARAVHRASPFRDRVFLPCNCAAVPRDLLDAQLFGYRKGAFTGAHADFPGIVRNAERGTLFLDEIGDLPLEVQPKLLRFLESGEIFPLGDSAPRTVPVRIVAATNANLAQLVEEGRFREDLYYRLNVVQLHVPPLRERREEIPPLARHFAERAAREAHRPTPQFDEDAIEALVLYRWPGNVRQLANELRRLVFVLDPGARVTAADLHPDIRGARGAAPGARAGEPTRDDTPEHVAGSRTAALPSDRAFITIRLDQSLTSATELLERALIRNVLTQTDRNVARAAEMLGLSRKGLFLKRRRYQID